MKIFFMKKQAIDFLKANMDRLYVNYYQNDDNSWIEKEFGEDPFVYFMDVPEFELAQLYDGMSAGEIDFSNCKIVYENLKSLSESQASDERLWAGLCNGIFYKYIRRRYGYAKAAFKDKKKDASGILSRFFFSGGTRAGFFRNAIAKCWWVGHATYDKNNLVNHFELLDKLGASDLSTKVSDIFYSNTFASNPTILLGICDSIKYFSDRGVKLRLQEEFRPALKYLNAVGGATLLDALSANEIKNLLIQRIGELIKGKAEDIQIPINDVVEVADDYIVDAIEMTDETANDDDMSTNEDENELNILNEQGNVEAVLDKPEYVTWGCYMVIFDRKANKEITYHIPLESDRKRELWPIERKMLGKQVGHRIYLTGIWYELVDYDWEEKFNDINQKC